MTEVLLPLSSRVDAPAVLPVPDHPDVATWRAARMDDVDAILEAQRLADRVDHPEWTTTREEIADDFGASHVDLPSDSIVGLAADGTVVAYGYVVLGPGQETRVQSYLFGTVRPDRRGRGIGRQLIGWQVGRSQQQLASSDMTLPGWSMLHAEHRNAGTIALAESTGFTIARYFTGMDRILADPIPEIAPVDGIRIVPCTPDLFESTRLARNDAFRDHWGSQPRLPEQWATFTGSSQFRSDLSWVALAGDGADSRVIALALSVLNEDDWELQRFTSGYIALIGVVREWRGRRLAPALISRLLGSYRDAGLERAVLDVDTASPTGAHSLYERLGFRATTQQVALVREY
ncbi:GNAT family N-acetyltransferase [Mycetocola sp. 2940]|uniref:GNAT family N-acetyltransferase n=1 Tax=Mycetocola sp. 2940 TaxID=3156452 RepID=UPI00339AB635